MSRGGWGRGRGRGGSGFKSAKQVPFDLFPEIEGFSAAKFSDEKKQLIKWSADIHRHWKSSPYYYVDPKDTTTKKEPLPANIKKPDIERFSDRESVKRKDKSELRDFIMLDPDHIPSELAEGGQRRRKRKKVQWNPDKDNEDLFEKMEKISEEMEGEKKENEDEEEEEDAEEEEEDDGEFSDEGDYEQNRDFDDDEDDFNPDDDDDGPIY